jgi:hypothetical protein
VVEDPGPLVYRVEVLAMIGALSDLWSTSGASGSSWRRTVKKKTKKQISEDARLRAERSPIVRQLRELYAQGMAEVEERRKLDPGYR